jgi:hypothetical protein
VHLASRAYQVESSDGPAGTQGVESVVQDVETAEECAGTADTAVAGIDTAAIGHNLLTGLLDGTGLPAVRYSGVECGSWTVLEWRPSSSVLLALCAWTPR